MIDEARRKETQKLKEGESTTRGWLEGDGGEMDADSVLEGEACV